MFQNTPLRDMLAVGAVTPRSARIWARSEGAEEGASEIRWRAAENPEENGSIPIALHEYQRDFTGSIEITEGLRAGCRYDVALHGSAGTRLASGSFRTGPEPDRPWLRCAIGLMSCHQPFTNSGEVQPAAESILQAAHSAFTSHDVQQLVLGGDQLYSDKPARLSLFNAAHFHAVRPRDVDTVLDLSREEVRALFQERYRHFWSLPGWRRVMSSFPCHPIIDDHDIVDNWGSAVEHGEQRWQAYRRGAFAAYCDYQHSLVAAPQAEPPEELDYRTELGDTATYVMDLRSHRRVGDDARVVSDGQIEALRRFLEAARSKAVVFVVLSVPIIHLPWQMTKLLARIPPDGEDFSDRWSTRGHADDRDAILRVLHDHQEAAPEQRVVLLSGDIHIGCLHRIRWSDRQPNLYQFVSSGITNDAGLPVQVLSSLIIRGNRRVTVSDGPSADFELVKGSRHAGRNPCGRLNFGIVELVRARPEDVPSVRFLIFTHRDGEPILKFRSAPIPPR